MRAFFDEDLNADVTVDDSEAVSHVNHLEPWLSEASEPAGAALEYLNRFAGLLRIETGELAAAGENVSDLEPRPQDVEYRLADERQQPDSTTAVFDQTYLNVPVWGAGITVTMKNEPFRVVSASNSREEGIEASLPPEEVIDRYRRLFGQGAGRAGQAGPRNDETTNREGDRFIQALLGANGDRPEDDTQLIRGRFTVYRYDPEQRHPQPETDAEGKLQDPPYDLPLPPVAEQVEPGRHYLAGEVTFSHPTQDGELITWLALVEPETESVLYLRALAAHVTGNVFVLDPISSSGNAGNGPDQSNAVLNPLMQSVTLDNLDPPVSGVQALSGLTTRIVELETPASAAPTEATNVDFDYDARTDDFAAVSAYYHTDRFFNLVDSLGIPRNVYFSNTNFPIDVDHRGQGVQINAHCVGNGFGGIGHCCYALAHMGNTTDPIGIAADWRVHLHELGGHGVLYQFVNGPNFGFSHSAGDSLAVILNDPESNAPDRFLLAPWVPDVVRRHDRDVAAGWAWDGIMDGGGYDSEQILSTTLFRCYRSIGGDSTSLSRRVLASRVMTYLVLQAIGTLSQGTNPSHAIGFANALIAVDQLNWTSEGLFGGAYGKVIRWSFERQGLYQPQGAPTPVTSAGAAPDTDVYIDDGRGGHYPYQPVHWATTTIWNRRSPDGIDSHEEPMLSATNYVYVKVKNRGTQVANNVTVRGFHCRPSAGLSWPDDLQPMTTASLPAGTVGPNDSEEKIVGPFSWTPITNAYGHDCLIMVVTATGDPSNADSFTPGENIAEWRLVPNDNNIAQRNVFPVPGFTGGLTASLSRVGFWVGNPNQAKARMRFQVKLPPLLQRLGWSLSFPGVPRRGFVLESGQQREVPIELTAGRRFTNAQVQRMENRDIEVQVFADDAIIGGMTYRLDPELEWPINRPRRGRAGEAPRG